MTDQEPVEHLTLFEALASAQFDMGPLIKQSVNPHFKSKYADLNSILALIRQPLLDNGLVVYQTTTLADLRTCLSTSVVHLKSGEFIESHAYLPSVEDPQKIMSAITYMRRAELLCMFNLNAEDDDGNAASGRVQQQRPEPEQVERTKPDEKLWDADISVTLMMENESDKKKKLARMAVESVRFGEPYRSTLIDRVNEENFTKYVEGLSNG